MLGLVHDSSMLYLTIPLPSRDACTGRRLEHALRGDPPAPPGGIADCSDGESFRLVAQGKLAQKGDDMAPPRRLRGIVRWRVGGGVTAQATCGYGEWRGRHRPGDLEALCEGGGEGVSPRDLRVTIVYHGVRWRG